ncbi:MAG: DUF1223 domain-containing protein [Chthoniobacter sp.]|uniref:DUF1223 domain-containing protein n=1 Tax=Chthoniobacter sp. TaxID=2510640 RepID=UPI0032AD8B8A
MKSTALVAALMLATAPLFAAPVTFESEETPTTLIELFTSEGCSSCPPADAWMSRLKSRPDLWKRFVPVAFHVDYWNSLGWVDRFSSAANTARQQRYAAAWRTESVYTPGLVLDGHEWRGWFRESLPEPSPAKVGKLAITVHDAQADVAFTRLGGATPLAVELALLGGNLESNVTRGENSGHKLRHDFTVLHFVSAPLRREGDRFVATVPFSLKSPEAPAAIAAWIVPGESRPPIQATGGWLRP